MTSLQEWNNTIVNIANNAAGILQRIGQPSENKYVVVFDIDDTLIHSNGYGIAPMINLYKYAQTLGYKTVIITSRLGVSDNIELTQKQLKELSITDFMYIYFRHQLREDPYHFKETSRKNVHERGYTIVMSIGDQVWDMGDYGGHGVLLPVYNQ